MNERPNTQNLIETGRLLPVGEVPRPGEKIPEFMYGQLIREDRYGTPSTAFQMEVVRSPRAEDLKPSEVIIGTMAAGVNYNNVYASLGRPINIVAEHKRARDAGDEVGFHIGGSDAAGIVYAVGSAVDNVRVGDHVVAHCGMWNEDDPEIKAGLDPTISDSFSIWGLEGNWGSFAQFSKLQAHQLMPKAESLTWEEAAVMTLDGATAYKMLKSWHPNTVRPGDAVLVWGGSGGLGYLAIQLVREFGGRPIAVVSSEEKGKWCKSIGAEGYIDRTQFNYWKNPVPDPNDNKNYDRWLIGGPRKFEKALEEILGSGVKPKIVFEHPGQETIPTSMYVCSKMGMVVSCAGMTGYDARINMLRFWTTQKRFQGSHFANDDEAWNFNNLVTQGKIKPYLSPKSIFTFDQTGLAHQKMYDNDHEPGKMAILVNAPVSGLGKRNTQL